MWHCDNWAWFSQERTSLTDRLRDRDAQRHDRIRDLLERSAASAAEYLRPKEGVSPRLSPRQKRLVVGAAACLLLTTIISVGPERAERLGTTIIEIIGQVVHNDSHASAAVVASVALPGDGGIASLPPPGDGGIACLLVPDRQEITSLLNRVFGQTTVA